MTLQDSLAYIPLFASFAVSIAILLLLLVIKKRSTARISFVAFLSTGIFALDNLYCAIRILTGTAGTNTFAVYTVLLFVAIFFILPYAVILSTFEPKKFEKLVPHSYNEKAEKLNAEAEKAEVKENRTEVDQEMLAVSQDFMLHGTDSFTNPNGLTSLLDYINKIIRERINADGGAVLMLDDFDDVIAVKSFEGDFPPPYKLPSDMPHKPVRIATNFKFASFPLKDNIFGEIAKSGNAELIAKPEMDNRIYQNGPEEFLECGSYIMVPLKIQNNVIGLTAFARVHGNPAFTNEELEVAKTLTDFAAASVKNVLFFRDFIEKGEMKKEADIATKIQEMLKPAKLPIVKGVQIGTIWNPSEGVCGDYYDVIVSRKDRVSFIMSDIAGKGMNSVVIMSMVRAMLRLVVNTTQSAGKILSWVNRGISSENFSTDHFGSCALINYNPIEQTVELATGGTTPVYHYDAQKNEIVRLSDQSEPLGVDKTIDYKDYVQKVNTGDIIFTYTDGLVEALNDKGQQYSTENLFRVIKEKHNSSGKDIANLVKADVKNFCSNSELRDDQTLLVVKIQ